MKEQQKFILLSILFVLVAVRLTASFSLFAIKQSQIETINVKNLQDNSIAISNQKTKIIKTETKEYYYYEVEDYERDLSYSWQFKKDPNKNISVEDSLYITEDLRLSLDASTSGAKEIEEKVDQKKLIVSFDYHGDLPLKTAVKINVSNKFHDGEHLYLYYYNPTNDTIEYIMKDVKVEHGYVEFQIEHCSDYFLTGAVVNDAVNNPKSVNFIIIGLVVVVFILIAVTLIQSKNK